MRAMNLVVLTSWLPHTVRHHKSSRFLSRFFSEKQRAASLRDCPGGFSLEKATSRARAFQCRGSERGEVNGCRDFGLGVLHNDDSPAYGSCYFVDTIPDCSICLMISDY